MDDPISKLPKYVFRRANGSYRYKRNVPKALREVIPKATVYRQLGDSYDEAIRRLPVVHAEVEALFDEERSTPNSVRAKSIVRERLGEWHAEVFADGVVDPEWDVTDDFRELAMELEGSTPPEVVRQVGSARLSPEPMTMHKVLSDYYTYKCDNNVGDKALKTNGITLTSQIKTGEDGNRGAWIEDPEGNRIELMEMAPDCIQYRAFEALKAR